MTCPFADKKCKLLEIFNINVPVHDAICKDMCDFTPEKILRYHGIKLPDCPDDTDYLEHAKTCVLNDLVELVTIKEKLLQQEEEKKLWAQLPQEFKIERNLKKYFIAIAKHFLKFGRLRVTESWYNERVAICFNCPSKNVVIDDDGIMYCYAVRKKPVIINNTGIDGQAGIAEYVVTACSKNHWQDLDRNHFQAQENEL